MRKFFNSKFGLPLELVKVVGECVYFVYRVLFDVLTWVINPNFAISGPENHFFFRSAS